MGFISDDDDVVALIEQRVIFTRFRHKLLQGGENHTAGSTAAEQIAQMVTICRLNRRITEQVFAGGECSEKLVVKVVAVCDDNDGWVVHSGMLKQASGIKRHRQTLAAALRVPDDADTAALCVERVLNRLFNRMELMI